MTSFIHPSCQPFTGTNEVLLITLSLTLICIKELYLFIYLFIIYFSEQVDKNTNDTLLIRVLYRITLIRMHCYKLYIVFIARQHTAADARY